MESSPLIKQELLLEPTANEQQADDEKCEFCGKIFEGSEALKRHVLFMHTGAYACKVCKKNFSKKAELSQHMKGHTGEKSCKCEVCGKAFQFSSTFERHIMSHGVKQNAFKCDKCGKSFMKRGVLKRHLKTHREEKPHKCEFCQRGFSDPSTMRRHLFTHSGKKPHLCELCGRGFAARYNLVTHMMAHTKEKPFKCQLCPKAFRVNALLKIHHNNSHGSNPCDVCKKSFLSESELREHNCTPHECKICGQMLSGKQPLEWHMRKHTGEKPYKCSICGKEYKFLGGMQLHKRSHTGEKPYKCKVCGKAFADQSYIKHHMIQHTGDKPKCTVCGNSYADPSTLRRHMKTHTGEKPFSCDSCSKSFLQKSQLRRHLLTHTGEKPFSCETCEKCFSEKGTLSKHMKTHKKLTLGASDETPKEKTVLQNQGNSPRGKKEISSSAEPIVCSPLIASEDVGLGVQYLDESMPSEDFTTPELILIVVETPEEALLHEQSNTHDEEVDIDSLKPLTLIDHNSTAAVLDFNEVSAQTIHDENAKAIKEEKVEVLGERPLRTYLKPRTEKIGKKASQQSLLRKRLGEAS